MATIQVTLNGGNHGGETVDWDDAQPTTVLDNCKYRLEEDHATATYIGDADAPLPHPDWPTWTTAEFFKRFTDTEYGAICTLALQSPLVFGLVTKLNAHPLVYAGDPELNAGLDALVNLGVFSHERKTEIVGGYSVS